jgi:hypothetical protein
LDVSGGGIKKSPDRNPGRTKIQYPIKAEMIIANPDPPLAARAEIGPLRLNFPDFLI